MLGGPAKLEVPRQVAVYFLLFAVGSMACLIAGIFFVSARGLRDYADRQLLTFLDAASQTVTLEYLRHGEQNLQTLVERLHREQGLLYCAVVSDDGRILAHSQRGRVGDSYQPPVGHEVYCGSSRGIRFTGPDHQFAREFHVALRARREAMGRLHVAAEEPGFWVTAVLAARYAPFFLVGPLILLPLGAAVMHRIVKPLALVETQLRRVALAPSMEEVELRPIQESAASTIGWNRIAERFQQQQTGALEDRLKSAVQVLRQEKSEDVLNSLAEGISVTDREGRISFANQALLALFSDEGPGRTLKSSSMEQLLGLSEATEATSPLLQPELRGRHVVSEIKRARGQEEQVFRVARAPVRTADGSPANGHVWSVRDVTQQKMAEKMRNQFLDAATHELRTPLANIKAYAETLAMSEMLDVESQKEFCNTINAEATRLARFIDDLLSISSMEVGSLALSRQRVDVERLFQEVIAKVKPQMEKKQITFDVIFPQKYPQLKLDKDKVIVAFVNLLGNAAKYTPDGGHVGLQVKATETELVVEVQDTGVGISAEELPLVFDKFFRSKNPSVQEQTGTGLGLSMAYEVIRLHGGDLTVQSELASGSTLRATFPLK